MYIIVSKDYFSTQRIPNTIENVETENWTIEEFMEKATSDAGMDIKSDDVLYFNLDILNEELYEALKDISQQYSIKYYKFSDQAIDLGFEITEGVEVFDSVSEEPVSQNQSQPTEQPTQEAAIPAQPVEQAQPQETQTEQPQAPVQSDIDGVGFISNNIEQTDSSNNDDKFSRQIGNMLVNDEYDTMNKSTQDSAKVILFGSSKGGTGKTFTALISAYRFATTHPNLKIAFADFDIIDGQVGTELNAVSPTLLQFYQSYARGDSSFDALQRAKVKSASFPANVDFYLTPPTEIQEITNDNDFWFTILQHLCENYDIVFFDSGIDYLSKPPISFLYKIADKIIITCQPTINSTRSVVRQLKALNGDRENAVFNRSDGILNRTHVVLTRVYQDKEGSNKMSIINKQIMQTIRECGVDIIAAFGTIDEFIGLVQWEQQWYLVNENAGMCKHLDIITQI